MYIDGWNGERDKPFCYKVVKQLLPLIIGSITIIINHHVTKDTGHSINAALKGFLAGKIEMEDKNEEFVEAMDLEDSNGESSHESFICIRSLKNPQPSK